MDRRSFLALSSGILVVSGCLGEDESPSNDDAGDSDAYLGEFRAAVDQVTFEHTFTAYPGASLDSLPSLSVIDESDEWDEWEWARDETRRWR